MKRGRNETARMKRERYILLVVAAFSAGLGGCKGLNVNLETPEPIKVDITMRVEVRKIDGMTEEKKEALASYKEVMERQRNRMAEIQDLKNSRVVGENHLGLLHIRSLPAGDYGKYVKKTVDAENVDRVYLMTRSANEKGEPLEVVQQGEWEKRKDASFPGEWVEIEDEEKGKYLWVKKEG